MKSEKERGKKERRKKNHRRDGLPAMAMKELGRVTFSLTPRPVVAHPGSPLGISLREKERFI
jgi:hypothetical protein